MRGFCRKQAPVLENRLQNKDEVVFVTSFSGVNFLYNTIPTQYDFAKFIMSDEPGAKYCNEMLFSHTCCGYIDIDCKESLLSLGFESESGFIQLINEFIKRCYLKYLKVDLKNKHIHWSSSCRPEKLVSYHVILKNPDYYWHKDDRKNLKEFMKQVTYDSLEETGFHTYEEKDNAITKLSIFDDKVYTKNRIFRCLGCLKVDSDVPFMPLTKKKD